MLKIDTLLQRKCYRYLCRKFTCFLMKVHRLMKEKSAKVLILKVSFSKLTENVTGTIHRLAHGESLLHATFLFLQREAEHQHRLQTRMTTLHLRLPLMLTRRKTAALSSCLLATGKRMTSTSSLWKN